MDKKNSSQSNKISGAEALIKALENLGVTTIFGYPGGANLPIYDHLRQSGIHHILARHEQGAAHMADGFARVAQKAGVCLATSGPGATNLVTGLANAMLDSTPMVALTGQIERSLIGSDAFQEVDCINITMPVTKHNELIRREKDLVPAVESAFFIAESGRKGPVLIDVPIDVLKRRYAHTFNHQIELKGYNPTTVGNVGQVKKALKALAKAERPVILFGGGVTLSRAVPEFIRFIRATNIPVVRTMMGTGIVFPGDPLFLGMAGTHGNQVANRILKKEADVIFVIGARLGDRSTKKTEFINKSAKVIHLDIDPAEIGKNISTNIPIVGDIKLTLEDMNARIVKKPFQNEKPWISADNFKTALSTRDSASLLEIIFRAVSEIDHKLNISTDVGRHQMWANHFCTNPKHLPLITSGGLGTMGFGLPAAIGAWFAEPETPAICLSGDGSFMMTMQEFVVAVENKVPLTVLILNDQRLGMIRELQRSKYGQRFTAHDFSQAVDFAALADAMGGKGMTVTHKDQIKTTLHKAISSGVPTIVDFDLQKIDKSSRFTVKRSKVS